MIPSRFARHRGALGAGALALAAAWGGVLPFEGTSKEPVDICPAEVLREPSGVAWHPKRKTLYVVGDEGDLFEMTADGVVLRVGGSRLDREGVTVGAGGEVYVLVEDPPMIHVFAPDLSRHRVVQIEPTLD